MKEKCSRIVSLLIAAIFVIAAFAGCSSEAPTEPSTPQTVTTKPKPQVPQFVMPDIEIKENRANELVFSVSINDYINAYNSLYREDNGSAYLTPSEEWQCTVYDEAIHSPHETLYYYFTEDERAFSLPTISVYVPTNGDYIQEVTVNFDDHSYSPEMYELYETMCFYTLKVFFPELSDERITELYKEANAMGDAQAFENREWYDSGVTPSVLYHRNGIGIYPYFAIGQWQLLCIIPVTEDTIAAFASRGTEIHEIA